MINRHLIIWLLCASLHLLGAVEAAPQLIEDFDDVESQLSIYPSDAEETSGLTGNNLIFSDFCITTRDNVMGDIRRTTSQLATNVFSMFYKSFGRIGLSNYLSQTDSATLDESSQIDLESQVASGGFSGDTQMDEATINSPPAASRGIFGSVMGVLSATKDAVAANVKQTLYSIKSSIGLRAVSGALKDSCTKVENYEREIRDRFREISEQLGGAVTTKLENLNCVTTNRLLSIGNFCRMVSTAHEPISRVLSLTSSS